MTNTDYDVNCMHNNYKAVLMVSSGFLASKTSYYHVSTIFEPPSLY